MEIVHPRARKILDFWWGDEWEKANFYDMRSEMMGLWFGGGEEVDKKIVAEFGNDCEKLVAGLYDEWESQGRLSCIAGIILGDQMSRNVYRGTPKMYAADDRVLVWVKGLLHKSADLPAYQRIWLFLPLMHSERIDDQTKCVEKFEELVAEAEAHGATECQSIATKFLGYAHRHKTVIERFGRFPHRNSILKRESTVEEEEGLRNGTIEAF